MSDEVKSTELAANGWPAVPRSFAKSLADVDKNNQAELSIQAVNPPSTNVAQKTHEFAKQQLPERTFNHSMRVWYYGE
jgi:cyanamide hydratase